MANIERSESLSSRIAGLSESLECGDGGVRGDFRAALAEVDALADQLRGAVEALERYGRHDHSCRSQRVIGQAPCNCGYEDVRAAVIGSS